MMNTGKKLTLLDLLEKLARILFLVSIPIAFCVYGWLYQTGMSDDKTNQEYVKLAFTILSEPKGYKSLRVWAVNLLNHNSPVSFTPDIMATLSSGKMQLPHMRASKSSLHFSPNGEYIVTESADGTLHIWDLQSGQLHQSIKSSE